MKEAIFGILLGLAIVAVGFAILAPYYSLLHIKGIAKELERIRKIMEEK